MGCCQSTGRDSDEVDGMPHDGANSGAAGQHASQTALTSPPQSQQPLHAPRSTHHRSHRGGGGAGGGGGGRDGGVQDDPINALLGGGGGRSHRGDRGDRGDYNSDGLAPGQQRYQPPLRQHVWTGRHRNPRSHQGDVAASRKVWTRRSLDRERQAFFETRVSNRPDVWLLLREVVAMVRDQDNLSEAAAMLTAAGVTVPSGDLADGAYDETGNFYPLVEYVVSDPKEIREPESDAEDGGLGLGGDGAAADEKGKEVERVPADAVEVKARLSNRGGPEADIKALVSLSSEPVRMLAQRVRREAGISDQSRLRIAYLGRVLKENRTLEEQGFKKGDMVNALVSE